MTTYLVRSENIHFTPEEVKLIFAELDISIPFSENESVIDTLLNIMKENFGGIKRGTHQYFHGIVISNKKDIYINLKLAISVNFPEFRGTYFPEAMLCFEKMDYGKDEYQVRIVIEDDSHGMSNIFNLQIVAYFESMQYYVCD